MPPIADLLAHRPGNGCGEFSAGQKCPFTKAVSQIRETKIRPLQNGFTEISLF